MRVYLYISNKTSVTILILNVTIQVEYQKLSQDINTG